MYNCNDIEEIHDHTDAGDCVAPDLRLIRDNELERAHRLIAGKNWRDYFRRRIEEDRAAAEREYGRPQRGQRK